MTRRPIAEITGAAAAVIVAAALVAAGGCAWDWERFEPLADARPDLPARCSWADSAHFTLSDPAPVSEVNTAAAREFEPFLSADGCLLYCVRDDDISTTRYLPR